MGLVSDLLNRAPAGKRTRVARAVWNGAVIAESDDTIKLEGNHYFPPGSVDRRYLRPSHRTTVCPWKGVASYYSLDVDGKPTRPPPGTTQTRAPPPRGSRTASRFGAASRSNACRIGSDPRGTRACCGDAQRARAGQRSLPRNAKSSGTMRSWASSWR
jgi:hypothetical protein